MKKRPAIALLICLLLLAGCIQTPSAESSPPVSSTPPAVSNSPSPDSAAPNIVNAPISRYFGSIDTDMDLLLYDFQVIQGDDSVIQITFTNFSGDTVLQTLSYQLRSDFYPKTITDGLQVLDLNNDGIDDFLFDLGIYGKFKFIACLVYDQETKQYVFIEECETLQTPKFLNGYFVTAPMPMENPLTCDRYVLDGTTLRHVGSLSIYQKDQFTVLYTESELINGEWVTTKDMVTDDEIDLTKWGRSPTQSVA